MKNENINCFFPFADNAEELCYRNDGLRIAEQVRDEVKAKGFPVKMVKTETYAACIATNSDGAKYLESRCFTQGKNYEKVIEERA